MRRTIIKVGFLNILLPKGADVGPLVSLLSRCQLLQEDLKRGLANDQWHYVGQGVAPRLEVISVKPEQLHGIETASVEEMMTHGKIGRTAAMAKVSMVGKG